MKYPVLKDTWKWLCKCMCNIFCILIIPVSIVLALCNACTNFTFDNIIIIGNMESSTKKQI